MSRSLRASAEDAYVICDALAAAYYRALDHGDWTRWSATFARDGQLVLKGRDPIVGVEGLARYWADRPAHLANREHVVTNVEVTASALGAIRAIAEFRTIDTITGDVLAIGSSNDVLIHTGESGWKYASKQIELTFRSPAL